MRTTYTPPTPPINPSRPFPGTTWPNPPPPPGY